MLQSHPYLRPRRLQWKALCPFHDQHPRLLENIFHPQCFKIMKILNAIKVHVIHLANRPLRLPVNVHQSKCRTGNLFLSRRSKSGNNPLRQRRFPAAQFPATQHHNRGLQSRSELPPPTRRLFRRMCNHLFSQSFAAPAEVSSAPQEPRKSHHRQSTPTHPFSSHQCPPPAHANTLPAPTPVATP